MNKVFNFIRAHEWWSVKVSLFYGVLSVYALLAKLPLVEYLELTLKAFISLFPIAAWANIVNDYGDIESDITAGKANRLLTWSAWKRMIITFGSIPFILIGPVYFMTNYLEILWIALTVVAFAAYSLPPLRFKSKGWLGAIADACGTQVFPAFYILSVFFSSKSVDHLDFYVIGGWLLFGGIRLHLVHQYMDAPADRKSNLKTIIVRYKDETLNRIIHFAIVPLELGFLLSFILYHKVYILCVFLLGYLLIQYLLRKKLRVHHTWYAVKGEERVWFSEFYNYYMLIASLVGLVYYVDYKYVFVLISFLFLFFPPIKTNIVELIHTIRWWNQN